MAVITRVYDDYATAERARGNLGALGITDIEVSVLGDESLNDYYRGETGDAGGTATGAGVGAVLGGGAGLLAGLGMIAIPGIGPLVAAGWLTATAVGAAGGALAGGAIGALADLGLSDEEAPVFYEAMRRGNVALSVRFPDALRDEVIQALDRVPALALPDLRSRFEAGGWRYEEAEAERQARLRDIPPGASGGLRKMTDV